MDEDIQTYSAIAEEPTRADDATEVSPETETDQTPEPELNDDPPGIFQDEEDDQEPDSLGELSPELAKDPAVARRWEEMRNGVQKQVDRLQSEREALAGYAQNLHILAPVLEKLRDPDTLNEGIEELRTLAAQDLGIDPDLDYATGTEVVKAAETRISQKYEDRITRLEKHIAKLESAETAIAQTPVMQKEFGSWVTTEMVQAAAVKYPTLPLGEAFAATHIKLIAQKASEYGASRKAVSPKGPQASAAVHLKDSEDIGDWRNPRILSFSAMSD